ncbi:MAG: MoaD/ThiS family protein [Candidatus Thorarchaeota archaeon]|nr:MoaD/ThiS family protein [Candidatus Thorarchaeota archaeon]
MIDVHLYGHLRKMVPDSKANEDTILLIEFEEGESFQELVERLGLEISNIGDCFINGRLAHHSDIVKNGDRIGLFPYNMRLIDGGMELKYSPYRR